MDKETRLKLAIGLSLVFMIIEIIGGYVANSIAIFSDAAHLLTDIAGFAIALLATIASKAPATKRLTFGFARAEVFGALASVLSLWVITFFLLYEAYDRGIRWYRGTAEPVNGFLMFTVAVFGVFVNLCLGQVFHAEHGGSMHPGHSHEHHHHHAEGEGGGGDHGHDHGHQGGGSSSSCSGHAHGRHSPSEEGSYQKVELIDTERGASHDHDHDHSHHASEHAGCGGGHDHSHGHGHSHDHGSQATERTSLLGGGHDHDHSSGGHSSSKKKRTYSTTSTLDGHADSDGHHGHSHGHDHGDVNIEAAYLHVITDLIQSVGVAIAGVIMWQVPNVEIIDPICTVIFSVIALYTTIPLLSRVFLILFEGTPTQIDWEAVMEKLNEIEGVEDVHDLHIWNISSTSISLTCHMRASEPQRVLKQANKICRKLGINHTTIQVHDISDPHFCYSQTCDWEHALDKEGLSVKDKKKPSCMTSKIDSV